MGLCRVILTEPVTRRGLPHRPRSGWRYCWISAIFGSLRGSFTGYLRRFALATAVVSRLYSILRLNPPSSPAGFENRKILTCWFATGPRACQAFCASSAGFLGALVVRPFHPEGRFCPQPRRSSEKYRSNESALDVHQNLCRLDVRSSFSGATSLGGPFPIHDLQPLYFRTASGFRWPAIQVCALPDRSKLITAVGVNTRPLHPPRCVARIRCIC